MGVSTRGLATICVCASTLALPMARADEDAPDDAPVSEPPSRDEAMAPERPHESEPAPVPNAPAPIPDPDVIVAAPPAPRPDISASRIATELVGAALFALPGVLIGAYAGYRIDCVGGCSGSDDPGLTGTLYGAGLGLALAMPLGVYVFGSDKNQGGSLAWTYASGLVAPVSLAGIALLAGGSKATLELPALALPLVPVGAIVGFTRTRRFKHGATIAIRPHVGADHTTLSVVGSF